MLNAPNLGIAPSASEIIAKHLREAIIAGHFAEDEPIRQDDIAQLFNVSKIPSARPSSAWKRKAWCCSSATRARW